MVKRSTNSGVDKAKKPAKAKTVKAPPPPEKPPMTQAEINRIGDIIRNARGTWFGLLGALVFAAVTLASVKDASFFIPSEQTKLPLLGISVPITSFFWAGALLVTALYTYLHLYLVQLWDALGDADPQFEGKPLADVIHPWLVSDAALRVRDSLRKTKDDEQCTRQRGMSMVGNIISILLVWVFGLAVIGWFWWRSMPAHDIWLTGWLGILLIWSLRVFWCSRTYALIRLGELTTDKSPPVWLLIFLIMIVSLTVLRTHIDILEGEAREEVAFYESDCLAQLFDEDWDDDICSNPIAPLLEPIRPARASMADTVFTQKPSSWKGYDLEKQEFRLRWCKQLGENLCNINPLDENMMFDEKEEEKFVAAWDNLLVATFATFNNPDFRKKRLEGANFSFAQLEGARFEGARLQGVDFWQAQLQGSDFFNAKLQGARIVLANMQGTYLSSAEVEEANLTGTNLQGSDLSQANMKGTALLLTNMRSVNLDETNLEGANFSWATIHGSSTTKIELLSSNLSKANFMGTLLRFIDFSEADLSEIVDFNYSFGDGSVNLAAKITKPEGWCDEILTDAQYWGRYQGWIEKHSIPQPWAAEIEIYPLIPFGTPCPE